MVIGSALAVNDVDHHFVLNGQRLDVLERIDLRVEPGEFVALLGPSGCGKSTLLRLIAGLDSPSRGSVSVDGEEIDGPDPARILVFQDPTLFPWRSVRKNVSLGLEAQGRLAKDSHRIDEALRLVKLEDFGDVYPHQLSGGMAQRASLARALVNDPKLLLLDEPLGKLDSLTRLAMQSELVTLWRKQGFTALMVTHDVEEALLLATRVVIFSARPARIIGDFPISKDYPRHRDEPALIELRRQTLDMLGLAASW